MDELFQEGGALAPFAELNKVILELNEEDLTDNSIGYIINEIKTIFNGKMKKIAVDSLISSFVTQGLTIEAAHEIAEQLKEQVINYFKKQNPTEKQQKVFDQTIQIFFDMFDIALDQYEGYAFTLPIQLEENVLQPTYAHKTDTGADLTALETVVVPSHSIGTKVRTGIRIALPENWTAYIVPRSSIGAKTPLRLSNSIGVIDSDYRGELGILYDNISDSDYTINAGDRIAQLIVMPAYHFKAQVVDTLPETERGEGGFGSTGK